MKDFTSAYTPKIISRATLIIGMAKFGAMGAQVATSQRCKSESGADSQRNLKGHNVAGNKKNKRKPAPKGIGSTARMIERLQTGLKERQKRIIKKNERIDRLNNLPMAHPVNASRLNVFGAIDKMIDEEERTGTLLCTEDGKAVMWEDRMHDFVEVVSSLLAVTHLMQFIARKYTLGDNMPSGLTAFALKVDRGEPITDQDRVDARETCAWIRAKIGLITPQQWKDAHDEYEAIETRLAEKESA